MKGGGGQKSITGKINPFKGINQLYLSTNVITTNCFCLRIECVRAGPFAASARLMFITTYKVVEHNKGVSICGSIHFIQLRTHLSIEINERQLTEEINMMN